MTNKQSQVHDSSQNPSETEQSLMINSALSYIRTVKPNWESDKIIFWRLKRIQNDGSSLPQSSFYALYGYFSGSNLQFAVHFDLTDRTPFAIVGAISDSERRNAPWGDSEFFTLGSVSIATKNLTKRQVEYAISQFAQKYEVTLPVQFDQDAPNANGVLTAMLKVGDLQVLPVIEWLSGVHGFIEVWPNRKIILVRDGRSSTEAIVWEDSRAAPSN